MLYTVLIALVVVLVIVGDQLGYSTPKEWLGFLGVTAPIWVGVMLLLLSACTPLQVTGNEIGGIVAGDTPPTLLGDGGDREVFAAATAHCAKYNRKPLIKSIRRGADYRSAVFECA